MESMHSPLFTLKTPTSILEVERFMIKNWGLSQHPTIDLVLKNKPDNLNINDAVTLTFDGQLFHAVIGRISFDEGEQVKLSLRTALAAALSKNESKVYSEKNLTQILQDFLDASGLRSGIDYELRLESPSELLWFYQDDESGLDFFQRVVSSSGLLFTVEQSKGSALYIISDSLDKLPKAAELSLEMNPPSGMAQKDEVSDLNLRGELCTAEVVVDEYNPESAACRHQGVKSRQTFAKGVQRLSGLPLGSAKSIQSVYDERSEMLDLISHSFALPGQAIILKESDLKTAYFRVASVTIVGFQQEAGGAFPAPLQESLHRSRLQFQLSMTPHLSGRSMPDALFRPVQAYKTAKVEHRSGEYADISEAGGYHIRLLDDEPSSSPKTKASPWVRQALYFAGNHYGFSHPLQDGSEVVTAFENGHSQRPMIIAALANKLSHSVVRDSNNSESLVKSASGSLLLLNDEEKKKTIKLASPMDKNHLTLWEDGEKAAFILQSREAGLHLHALENLNYFTKEGFTQLSQGGQKTWVNGEAAIQSEKGHLNFESSLGTALHTETLIEMNAKKHSCSAGDTLRMQAEELLRLNFDKSILFNSEQGEQNWLTPKGSIYFKVSENLVLKSGDSSVRFSPEAIHLSTASILVLNAPEIHGLG